MVGSLDEIRKRLKQREEQKERGFTSDNALYRFWDIPENSTAVLRFLPDKDPENMFFWVERAVIKLPFDGVVGGDDKKVLVEVPCMHMFGETCPILEETKSWWDNDELKETARTYYKKRSYVYQGFVVNSPLDEKEVPENPIRRFVINSSVHNIIKASLMDDELEDLPIDFENGLDFRLTKTKKGQYADYSTSNWSRKVRPLSDDELEAVEAHGLHDLKSFLPAKPDEEKLKVIFDMFESSLNGDAYDPERFGKYYKPFGLDVKKTSEDSNDSDDTEETETKTTVAVKKKVEEKVEETPVKEEAKSSDTGSKPKKSPQELLEELRRKRS